MICANALSICSRYFGVQFLAPNAVGLYQHNWAFLATTVAAGFGGINLVEKRP